MPSLSGTFLEGQFSLLHLSIISGTGQLSFFFFILLEACGVDQSKIDRLRETLNLPETTEQVFCNYITKEYPATFNYSKGEFIRWVAVKRPDALGLGGTFVISISPLYPALEGTVYAFAATPDGRQEEVVPAQQDKRVSIEELYRLLTSLFILFCPIA